MDNLHGPDSPVAIRYSYFKYHGRTDPYSARNCNNNSAGPRNSGAKGPVGRAIPARRRSVHYF